MFKQEYEDLNQKMMNNKKYLNINNMMESETSSEANVTDLIQELKELKAQAEKEDLIRKEKEEILEKEGNENEEEVKDIENEENKEEEDNEEEKLKYEPINSVDEPPELLDIDKEKKILKEKRDSLVNLRRKSSLSSTGKRDSDISSSPRSYYEKLNNNVINEEGINTEDIFLDICFYPTEDSVIDEFGVYINIIYYFII